jgi:hypothetical protein
MLPACRHDFKDRPGPTPPGLADGRYARLKGSAEVQQLHGAALKLAEALEGTFLNKADVASAKRQDHDRWCRRYQAALRRLRKGGIATTADEQRGAAAYISLRSE